MVPALEEEGGIPLLAGVGKVHTAGILDHGMNTAEDAEPCDEDGVAPLEEEATGPEEDAAALLETGPADDACMPEDTNAAEDAAPLEDGATAEEANVPEDAGALEEESGAAMEVALLAIPEVPDNAAEDAGWLLETNALVLDAVELPEVPVDEEAPESAALVPLPFSDEEGAATPASAVEPALHTLSAEHTPMPGRPRQSWSEEHAYRDVGR